VRSIKCARAIDRRTILTGAAALTGAILMRTGSVQSQALHEIRVADTTSLHEMSVYAIPDFIGPDYAIKQFNFGAAGISGIAAMMTGRCDAMSTANSYFVTSCAEGAKLVAVCGVAGGGQAIVARQDRGIARLEDLKGKRIVTKLMTS
jgi:ABC-type taurine transport system substrate-binding protein